MKTVAGKNARYNNVYRTLYAHITQYCDPL